MLYNFQFTWLGKKLFITTWTGCIVYVVITWMVQSVWYCVYINSTTPCTLVQEDPARGHSVSNKCLQIWKKTYKWNKWDNYFPLPFSRFFLPLSLIIISFTPHEFSIEWILSAWILNIPVLGPKSFCSVKFNVVVY